VVVEKNQFLSLEDLKDLITWKSSGGILSIYVDVKDRGKTALQRWKATIKSGLNQLAGRHSNDENLKEAIKEAYDDLMNLPQDMRKRSLIYFRSTDSGKTFHRSLQLPLDNHFVWMNTAFLRPVISLMDEAPVVGIAVLSMEVARIMTWRQGIIDADKEVKMELETGLENEPTSGAGVGQRSGSSADTFKHKVDVQVSKKLEEVAKKMAELAEKYKWQNVILMGSPKFTDVVEEHLPSRQQNSVVGILDKNYINSSLGKIEEVTTELLWSWKRQIEFQQVGELINTVGSGGRALVGVQQSIDAMEQFRVEKLFFNSDLNISGYRDTNGTYLVDVTEEEAEGLEVEPHIIERMIELAFESGAKIVPLEDKAAEKLGLEGGIGVLLRY